MGKATAESLPVAMELFDRANECLGYDLKQICFEGPEAELHATENSQPALFVTSMVALERIKQENPSVLDACTIAAGLSLGEYSALCFAGVLSFEDALRTVRRRGQAMQKAADAQRSGMVAVLGMERNQVEELMAASRDDGVLEIANLVVSKEHRLFRRRCGLRAIDEGCRSGWRDESRTAHCGRCISHVTNAGGGRRAGRRARRCAVSNAANSCCFQRRRKATFRSGRNPRTIDQASRKSCLLGGLGALHAFDRNYGTI